MNAGVAFDNVFPCIGIDPSYLRKIGAGTHPEVKLCILTHTAEYTRIGINP